MTELTYLVAPIFLIILLGKFLRLFLVRDDLIWQQINKLSYWVLFPCLLFNKTSVIDFGSFSIGAFSVTLLMGFSASVVLAFVASKFFGLSNASLSSVMQGSGRHNSFVALAVVSQFLGEQGAMLGALAVAVLVSFSNIVTIIILTELLSNKQSGKNRVLLEVTRNPFIVAIFLGITFNVIGWGNIPILHEFTANVGKAALPLALICVGAGLRFAEARAHLIPTTIACFCKLIIFPTTAFGVARFFDLSDIMTMTVVIFAAAPTSSTAYALAKQMGGDAPLMATIISLQTLLSVLIIPGVILLLQ